MVCKKCGSAFKDGIKICPNCGTNTENNEYSENDKTVLLDNDDKTVLVDDNEKTELVPEDESKTALIDDDKTVLLDEEENESSTVYEPVQDALFGDTYKIVGKIGEGGFGAVYKAYHTRLQKDVVIKQIKTEGGTLDRNETDLLKSVKHSYLPQVLDFIETDGKAYTVMDFISGSDIEKLVKGGRKFRTKEIIKIAQQLCEAVSYLHKLDPPVIHSDIKPANVMLSENGNICLIDFNVSLAFDKNASAIGGTRGYAPPEQLGIPLSDIKESGALTLGKVKPIVSERSDVYSIGAFLYFLITGEAPSSNYILKPLANTRADIPDGLIHVVSKAMMLSPQKRYKNAGEMLDALKNIGKLEKRYKVLKLQRAIATISAVVLLAAFFGLNRTGSQKLEEEHEEKYQSYIEEIENKISAEEYDSASEIINTAEEFEPTRIEPYYNNTKILYETKKYQECADYPDSVITAEIKANELNDKGLIAQMYEMAADSAFQLEEYESAAALFETTLRYSDSIVDCYRDLTISYARSGNIDKAEDTLETARSKNIANDTLELMQGEIFAAKGDTQAAYDCFVKVLELTDDDYVRFRALLVCDKTMIADSGDAKENSAKMAQLLENQINRVSTEYYQTISEMLANEYTRAEEYQKAADVYEKLLTNGTLGYSMQKNYFNLLYSQLGDYNKCLSLLESMGKMNPEDYWVDMNECFVMISVENGKEQTLRDYSEAYGYYKSADRKYKQFTLNGKTDANMDILREAIKELKSYGWITED